MQARQLIRKLDHAVFTNPLARSIFSDRTLAAVRFDLLRRVTRTRRRERDVVPAVPRLHFGCGRRRIPGWLNVDVAGSEFDVDLAAGRLPWSDDSFDAAVSQHVIEHLDLSSELVPLLRELRRVLRPGGEIWLSCPDLEKLCRAYVDGRLPDLIQEREERSRRLWAGDWTLDRETGLGQTPPVQMINSVFYQDGEHRNLFDFELLKWTLEQAGFSAVRRVVEQDLLDRFPEFPPRYDDAHSLVVTARA